MAAWSAGACSSARRPESAGRLAGSVLAVESIRGVNGSGTVEIRYFLSSCHDGCWFRRSAGTGRLKMGSIGCSMSRSGRMAAASGAARNLAILRKIAINLMGRDRSPRISMRARRKQAAWNDEYMMSLLVG